MHRQVWIEENVGAHCHRCGDLIIPSAKTSKDRFECTDCGSQIDLCPNCRQQRICDNCANGILVSILERRSILRRFTSLFKRFNDDGIKEMANRPTKIFNLAA